MLQRHVQIGQHMAAVHQRYYLIHMRIRIHIVQPDPGIMLLRQLAQRAYEIGHVRAHRLAVPKTSAEFHIDAIGTGVLRDHQQFLHTGLEQVLGFQHHLGNPARHEIAAHRRNDAEAAAMIAAFGNFQVRIVARRQLHALRRHEIDKRLVRLGQMRVHRVHHLAQRMRAGDGQHFRMHFLDQVVTGGVLATAETAGHDDFAIFTDRLTDGVQRFLHCRVDETAGIDDDQICAVIGLGRVIAFGAQLGEDLLGIDQGFRAAERHESDFGCGSGRHEKKIGGTAGV